MPVDNEEVAMTQPTTEPTAPPPGEPEPTPTLPAVDPSSGDRKGGDRAILADLAKERDKRQALEQQLAELSPLKKLADLIRGGEKPADGKSEVDLLNERFATYEKDLAAERLARWRAEVAQEKGLTVAQAARLQGASRDELAADADALAELFPTAPAVARTPAPDPTQGARSTGPADLDALIADAEKRGDAKAAIALKARRLTQLTNK